MLNWCNALLNLLWKVTGWWLHISACLMTTHCTGSKQEVSFLSWRVCLSSMIWSFHRSTHTKCSGIRKLNSLTSHWRLLLRSRDLEPANQIPWSLMEVKVTMETWKVSLSGATHFTQINEVWWSLLCIGINLYKQNTCPVLDKALKYRAPCWHHYFRKITKAWKDILMHKYPITMLRNISIIHDVHHNNIISFCISFSVALKKTCLRMCSIKNKTLKSFT